MKLVSIILPTFNGEKFIESAIDSCLSQSYSNIELVIVNDCSDDNTGKIIEQYMAKDKRVRVITNARNMKLPGSLNIGFDNANGEYFTWISDDNLFGVNAIEKMVGALENDERADIVYSSYSFIDEENRHLGHYGDEPEFLVFSCIVGACFLYRKHVHVELKGYDREKFRMEDMDFWLRAAEKFRFLYLVEPDMYKYRKHSQSLTSAIYGNEEIRAEYLKHYFDSFEVFFNKYLKAAFSKEDITNHINIFFEHQPDRKALLSDQVMTYVNHFDKLNKLDWELVGFRRNVVSEMIEKKREKIIGLMINDLQFENQKLRKKNPKLALHLNKPISWYYKEYETLPLWYKRIGHVIKFFQRNKSW
ncbi:glycosyltransferase family 2 protein [Chitinophagaceae bacterium 26-R-25]|nr:glycosyltransferase family 2 protein [Chitinophagaceae bacterium 26-R-25]